MKEVADDDSSHKEDSSETVNNDAVNLVQSVTSDLSDKKIKNPAKTQ